MLRTSMLMLTLVFLSTACRSGRSSLPPSQSSPAEPTDAAPTPLHDDADPWAVGFDPPVELATERVRLEPLAPRHAELDFEALMGSREHLQRTLRWGDWPRAGFTLEENRSDLQRHQDEFDRREAYAYTVLSADGSRCVGCIYLNPVPARAGVPEGTRAGMLAFWVIEEELASDLDRHLVAALLDWFGATWPLDVVMFTPRADDARGAELLADAGLAELDGPQPEVRLFVWEAD